MIVVLPSHSNGIWEVTTSTIVMDVFDLKGFIKDKYKVMDNIKKVSIKRLADGAGVKSLSDDCYDVIREIIEKQIKDVVTVGHTLMVEDNSKTLTVQHVNLSLHYKGYYNFL